MMNLGENNLCIDCGICCDGSLFKSVALTEWDNILLNGMVTDLKKLPQPCAYFNSHKCLVYDCRPEGCVKFKCDVLIRFEQGLTTLEESKFLIEEAKTVRDKGFMLRTFLGRRYL